MNLVACRTGHCGHCTQCTEISDLRAEAEHLRSMLRRYALGRDCAFCDAQARLVSESYPLSPGSRCTVVVPKYWTVDHAASCNVERALHDRGCPKTYEPPGVCVCGPGFR